MSMKTGMSSEQKVGWLTIAFLVALAIAMIVSAQIAHAEPASRPTLVERLIAVQPSLQSLTDEPVDARELAESIAAVPRINLAWAALILTIAHHEATLSARIAANDCKPKECDGGRAWGLYQGHKNLHNADVWGSPDIRVQTLEAARALRRAFYLCNGRGKLRDDWVARTINGYAGRRCDAAWDGLDKRLATYNRIWRRL